MDKNTDNNDKQAVSRAVAHDVEEADVVIASEYLDPPPLFVAASPEHVKEESESEEKDQKLSPSELTEQNDQTNSPDPLGSDMKADGASLQANAQVKEDEKEEEIKDSEPLSLLFADDTPETPNEEGDDENGAGGLGDDSNADDGNNNPLQKKDAAGSAADIGGTTDNNVPGEVMAKMEHSMGADFSDVKINTNSEKASDAGALAYTQGNSIDFAPGQFNPESTSGQKLLGHELAHVVQQREGKVQPTTSVNGMSVNDDAGLENEADKMGDAAAGLTSPIQKKDTSSPTTRSSSTTIQRQVDGETSDFSIPGVTRMLSGWEVTAFITALKVANGHGLLSQSMEMAVTMTSAAPITVGIGVAVGGGVAAGVGLGYGIVVSGGEIGMYGTGSIDIGLLASASAELVYTVTAGGLSDFGGSCQVLTVGGGELLVGHVQVLFTNDGDFFGVAVAGGVGAGLPVDIYWSYAGTVVPEATATENSGSNVQMKMDGGSEPVSQLQDGGTIQREQAAVDKTPTPPASPNASGSESGEDLVCLPDGSTENPEVVPEPKAAPTPENAGGAGNNSTPVNDSTTEEKATPQVPGTEQKIDEKNVNSGVDWGKFWEDNKLNIGRTVAEPFRLIPVWGLFPGFAADIMETIGDLDAAKPANDKFLDFLIAIRSPVVIMHNMFGHFAYIGELAQDVAVGSILGIELAVFTGPFNETMNGIKAGLLVAQTVIDASVVARTMMEMSDASHTQEELNAYKGVFAGFEANLAMDGIDLILTGLSMGSAGLANGSVISQGARVTKNVVKQKELFKSLSSSIIQAWAGVWGGNAVDAVLPDPVKQQKEDDGVMQQQSSGEKLARNVAGELILMELGKIETAYNVGTGLLDHAAGEVESIGSRIDQLSEVLTDEKAVPALKRAMNKGLDFLTAQLTGLEQTQPFITTTSEKAVQLNEMLDGVLAKIDAIPLLVATAPESDFIPDIIEEAGTAAANKLLAQVNKLITKAKEDAKATILVIKSHSEEIAEFLQTLIGVLGDQIDFVKKTIKDFQESIKDVETLSDIVDILVKEVSEWLGIDPPLSTTVIKEGWQDVHTTIQGGFTMARAMVNEKVKGNPTQGKFEQDPLPTSEEPVQRQKDLNLTGLINQEENVESAKDELSEVFTTGIDGMLPEGANEALTDFSSYAFSMGNSLFGEASNVGLLAHEAMHTIQQKADTYHDSLDHTDPIQKKADETGSNEEPIQQWPNPLEWVSEQYNNAQEWYEDEKDEHYSRNDSNEVPLTEPIGDDDWRLLPDSQSVYHQNGEGGRGNRKYVSTDGGNFEAVYDSDGNLVTDDANQGTYNHHGPDDAWGHWKEDVLPYWLWGNTEEDDTPLMDRLAGPRLGERIGEYAGGKWQDIKDGAGDMWDSASETASETWDSVSETAGDAWEGTKNAAGDAWDSVSETAGNTWETVSETAGDGWDAVKDTASDTWESVSDGASGAWDSITGFFGGGDTTQEKRDERFSIPAFQLRKEGNIDLKNNEPQQLKEENPLQRMIGDEKDKEEELQLKAEGPVQRMIGDEKDKEDELQLKEERKVEKASAKSNSNAQDGARVAKNENDSTTAVEQMIGEKGVRLHKDSTKATEVGALAYAQGKDIHFAPGQYNPNSRKGQELIGHELHHITQQSQGKVKPTTTKAGMNINDDAGLEKEADDFGVKFADSLQNKTNNGSVSQTGAFSLSNAPVQKKAVDTPEAPMQLTAAEGGSSEGGGPISVDGSQTVVKDLMSSPALPLFDKMDSAPGELNAAMSSESSELNSSFPNIEQPTGIENRPLPQAGAGVEGGGEGPMLGYADQGGAGDTTVVEPASPAISGPHDIPMAETERATASPPSPVPTVAAPGSTSVSIDNETIDYSAGPRPPVDTSGEADPALMSSEEAADTATVQGELTSANTHINEDHGEDDIYPHYSELEMLTPAVEIPQGQEVAVPEMDKLTERSPEVDAAFNGGAQEKLSADMAEHITANEAEVAKMDAGSQEEWTKYETDKTAEEDRVKAEQEAAQNTAQTEVNAQQQNWQTENDAVKEKFVSDAGAAKIDYQGQITSEINSTDSQVEATLAQAEVDAQVKADEATEDAAVAEREKEEKENRGFWGRVADSISKAWDWLKDQFNAIITWLKEAVTVIIEAAKEAANRLIDAARNVITGLIRAFGELLKRFVDIAFAAFPEIRDRIKQVIDTAVNTAVDIVNALADGLKAFVSALLDALGNALKFLLDAYQRYINFLFSAIEFIVNGLYELYKGLTNLALSAKQSPGHFMGQLQEEFLGMNLSDPLPFERSSHPPASHFRPPEEGEVSSGMGDMPAVLERDPLTASDIEVMAVQEPAGPELSEDLMNSLPEGGEREFGGSDVDELDLLRQAYASADEGEGGVSEEASEMTEADAYPYAHLADDPTARADAELDTFLGNQPAPDGASSDAQGAQAEPGAIDENMKIGPFTQGQRFRYLRTQMWNGITTWFNANKVAIIAGIVGAVVAGIALIIASGGAVLSLIPPLMTILGAFFLGEALVKAGSYLRNFLTKAWGGGAGLADGAKDFARAMVIMVVELIFILLFDLNTVIKAARAGLKGSIRMAAQGAKNTGRALVNAGRRTATNIGRNLGRVGRGVLNVAKSGTKITANGLRRGFSRGVKSVGDLMERVKSLRFKKFKLVRSGRFFRIFGKINPWVLLASGKIVEVEGKGGVKVGQEGDFVVRNAGEGLQQGDEVSGILVGGQTPKSHFVQDLMNGGQPAAAAQYTSLLQQIRNSTDATASIRGSGLYRNPNFRSNFFKLDSAASSLSTDARRFLSIHHVLPNSVRGLDGALDLIKKLGRSIDEVDNAIALPRVDLNQLDGMLAALKQGTGDPAKLRSIIDEFNLPNLSDDQLKNVIDELTAYRSRALHNDYHTAYTNRIKQQIDAFVTEFDELIEAGATEADALKAIQPDFDRYLAELNSGLLDSTSNILK